MKPSKTQIDNNLDFNGQADGVNYKENTRHAGNQHGEGFANPDRIQMRQMPFRKGNDTEKTAGPVTAKGAHNVESGLRKWVPSATENYVGDFNKIHIGNPITRGNPKG